MTRAMPRFDLNQAIERLQQDGPTINMEGQEITAQLCSRRRAPKRSCIGSGRGNASLPIRTASSMTYSSVSEDMVGSGRGIPAEQGMTIRSRWARSSWSSRRRHMRFRARGTSSASYCSRLPRSDTTLCL